MNTTRLHAGTRVRMAHDLTDETGAVIVPEGTVGTVTCPTGVLRWSGVVLFDNGVEPDLAAHCIHAVGGGPRG